MSTDAAATTQQEAAAFADMVGRYIARFGPDAVKGREVEAALIDLEVQHTKHLNALKREFNADLTALETAQKHNMSILEERAQRHEEMGKKVKAITADYKHQLAQSSESYQRALRNMKIQYKSLLAEQKHMTKTVGEVQELSEKQIQHLKEEHERVVLLKEKEKDALQRRLDSVLESAAVEWDEAQARCREVEDENAQLRRELLQLQGELNNKNATITDVFKSVLEDRNATLSLAEKLVSDTDARAAQMQVIMSQMRAVHISGFYKRIRAALREGEVAAAAKEPSARATLLDDKAANASDVSKEIDEMEAHEAANRQQLGELMDAMTELANGQTSAVAAFHARLNEALTRAREQCNKYEETLREEERRGSGPAAPHSNRPGGLRKDVFAHRARRGSSLRSTSSSTTGKTTNGNSQSNLAVAAAGDSPSIRANPH